MAKKKKSKRSKRRTPPSVERRIMFYRIYCGVEDNGKNIEFDPQTYLQHIEELEWSYNGRYLPTIEGGVICSWIDNRPIYDQMRFATVRRAGLPLIEDGGGSLSSLSIPANSGIAEITHLKFFPNNIIGCVFNFYGPRVTRLSTYLKVKVPSTPNELTIEPLIRSDIVQQLDKLETIRLVDLKIRPSYNKIIEKADDNLAQAFNAATEAVTEDLCEVELVLKSNRNKYATLGSRILSLVKNLASRRDLRENATRFIVRGLDSEKGKIATIDLLSDKLVTTKKIVRQNERSRALDNSSAYRSIQESYEELRDELEIAEELVLQS